LTAALPALGAVPHVAPAVTDDTRAFWTGGEVGQLRIARCQNCRHYLHPPAPVCRRCRSLDVAPEAVSGRGTLASYTVNHQQWGEEFGGPYIVALVEIAEEPELHLITNLVDLRLDEVEIGMPLEVDFVPIADAWLPIFRRAR
jgi:uncharacterized protein